MRAAYADPPYMGQARNHYGPEAREVNHPLLVAHLLEYDAWALSLSSTTLLTIARLQWPDGTYVVPEDARIGAWVKPFASFKRGVDPAYVWEPVLFQSAREASKDMPTVRDWVSANITMQRGTSGAKPEAFCRWLFALLGMQPGDTFVDLFPGSGAVSEAWKAWRRWKRGKPVQLELEGAA